MRCSKERIRHIITFQTSTVSHPTALWMMHFLAAQGAYAISSFRQLFTRLNLVPEQAGWPSNRVSSLEPSKLPLDTNIEMINA